MSSKICSLLLHSGKQHNIGDEWMSLAHRREVSLLALLSKSLYEETAFQLSSHLVIQLTILMATVYNLCK